MIFVSLTRITHLKRLMFHKLSKVPIKTKTFKMPPLYKNQNQKQNPQNYQDCDTSQQAAKYSVNFGSLPYVNGTQPNAVLMTLLAYPAVFEYWMTQYLSGVIVHFLASFPLCLSKQKYSNVMHINTKILIVNNGTIQPAPNILKTQSKGYIKYLKIFPQESLKTVFCVNNLSSKLDSGSEVLRWLFIPCTIYNY